MASHKEIAQWAVKLLDEWVCLGEDAVNGNDVTEQVCQLTEKSLAIITDYQILMTRRIKRLQRKEVKDVKVVDKFKQIIGSVE